ncbi:hypothetical protein EG359_06100 [Chryseobacterium joostei]|uniref:Uncharacterized protein n=1 Tax=Chryseobacterium joostei TaxID=112234 RepID=A0ABN5SB72_9FLAO|nr:hypothetical protein EG359_06100 [Chryseobacterium joostei]RXM63152.1 hypothetical protein BOQ60_17555 [Chryseobacterium sp. CH1]
MTINENVKSFTGRYKRHFANFTAFTLLHFYVFMFLKPNTFITYLLTYYIPDQNAGLPIFPICCKGKQF